MQPPPKTIESYITQTLTAEQQAADAAQQKVASASEHYDQKLRINLQNALDRDDKKTAIKIAHELMADNGEDNEFDILYNFLLTRVGVERREPLFTMSLTPGVLWTSAICVIAMLTFMTSILLTSDQTTDSNAFDVWSCLGTAFVLGTPLWDMLIAMAYNYVNRYRMLR